MGRAPCCDKANVKRGPWSPEEDATLKNYIHSHGTGGNWISLPHKAGLKRCGKSCRLRWLNYLRPNIKHGGFTEEEDYIICSLYSNIGSRWSVIASRLPGRTDNDVKNYWNTKLKKKLLSGTTAGLNSMNFTQSSQSSAELSYFHQMPTLPSPPVVSNSHTNGSNSVSGSSSVGLDSWGGSGEDDELLMTLCFEASDHFLNGSVFEEQISEVDDPNLSNPPQC